MFEFDRASILEGLNDRQREAVQATQGPVLVVAGPGSGKTRVLTCRIAWLLATETARSEQVLALTFTNKAAREMRGRVQKLLPEGMTRGMWVGTFHSQMVRLLRLESVHLGFTSDFTIYDTDDSERVIKQLLHEQKYDPKEIKSRTVRGYISEAKNARRSAAQMKLEAKSKQARVAADLYDSYNAALKISNAFDFDDLLLKPLELFASHPEILQRYQSKWSHVLIDEYQDTNHVQYLLAYTLSEGHRNLCVVGDDAQSIYAFRGADIQNIFSFERDFDEARVIRLEQNYRSTDRILNAADAVISNNVQQIKKKLWTNNGSGHPITVVDASDDRDEARRAVQIIRREQVRGKFRYQDFAILYRTNVQSRTFEEALRSAGVPYKVVGGLSFYQRKEVKDAVAYLRLLVNPNDISSFQRVVNYPPRGIGIASQQKVIEYACQPEHDLSHTFDRIDQVPIMRRAQNALVRFAQMIRAHTKKAESGLDPSEVAASLFRDSGLIEDLELDETRTGQIRLENIQELLRSIQAHVETDESHTLSSYLQTVALMTDADTDKSDAGRVVLMTLHASKGLEFQVVFIGGMEEKLLPLIRGEKKISRKDLEEERRLLYVGITRAKSHLYLSWAKVRSRYGGNAEYKEPSRFMGELGLNYRPPVIMHGADNVRNSRNQALSPSHRKTSRKTGFSEQSYGQRDLSVFRAGVRVKHKKLGYGRILSVDGQKESTTATVHFGAAGMKKIRVKFAPMKIVK